MLSRERSEDKYTRKSPQFSRKSQIKALCFRNHNIDYIKSRRCLGGGFQICNETEVKEVEDMRTIMLRQRKLQEIKALRSKNRQLDNFELKIGSSKVSKYKKVIYIKITYVI